MVLFKVTDIIDGKTIEVAGWGWSGHRGKKVIVEGYTVSDEKHDSYAKSKLQILLKDKSVELKGVTNVEKGKLEGDDTIYCSVYLNDIDISQYFPELTH